MFKLVLLRHGQSQWNLENKFTGWTDVPLSPKGIEEARKAGRILKQHNYSFDIAYTSVLKRAIHTLWLALEEMDQFWIPVKKSWRLNERTLWRSTRFKQSRNSAKSIVKSRCISGDVLLQPDLLCLKTAMKDYQNMKKNINFSIKMFSPEANR